ncbi:MAG TPA: hypothetical protein VJZ27_20285, partial [Aggregatilineales bacterium]|nr:hypothetical protein [Aggregatilineales bacterium]
FFVLTGLLVYGYLAGRRMPFVVSLSAIGGGVVLGMMTINPWLLPLSAGIVIVAGVLLMETQRPLLEGWYFELQERLQ